MTGFWAEAARRAPLALAAALLAVAAALPVAAIVRRRPVLLLLPAAALAWVLPVAWRALGAIALPHPGWGIVTWLLGAWPGLPRVASPALLCWPLALLCLGLAWRLPEPGAAQAWRLAGIGAWSRLIGLRAGPLARGALVALAACTLALMRGR